jgi:hypothetical protein
MIDGLLDLSPSVTAVTTRRIEETTSKDHDEPGEERSGKSPVLRQEDVDDDCRSDGDQHVHSLPPPECAQFR